MRLRRDIGTDVEPEVRAVLLDIRPMIECRKRFTDTGVNEIAGALAIRNDPAAPRQRIMMATVPAEMPAVPVFEFGLGTGANRNQASAASE